jgi:phosphatidyl-myo-inositol alpha-mannosyltransferase
MRVLLVTPFDFTTPGGVNEHILHLDRQLREFGHETRILAPRAEFEDEGDDGHFFRLGLALPIPANGSTARVTLSPFVSGKVKEFLQREQFDIVHLNEPLTPTLPLMVLLHSETVNVGTFHASRSSHFGFNLGYLYGKPILSYFFEKLHARMAVSTVAKEFIHYYFPGDYRVVPNGIDLTHFGPDVPPVDRYNSDDPTILFVGRYNESRKGFKYLLQAFALVRTEFPRARLLVVGPGDAGRYERIIESYGIRNVVFVGSVPKEELPAYYATCDVFCAPSTGLESFGIVLLEGMAAGRPVIATDIDGYRDVVRHEVEGLLVEPRNAEALAMALVHVLADRDLAMRLGQAGRARVRQFSWPVVAAQVVECYEAAIGQAREMNLTASESSSMFSTRRS